MRMPNDNKDEDDIDPRHVRLQQHPLLWAGMGVVQTLLTAGIVFGWASLVPILRQEGVDHSPLEFAKIFTCGAVGNYMSTLAFGYSLDHYGPRPTAMLASTLFSIGLILCGCFQDNFTALLLGIGLLGFAGPGIQGPTLHLANLFASEGDTEPPTEGGSGGSAVYMSCQAAAFDGGTAVFAMLRLLYQQFGIPSSIFFLCYLIIPIGVFVTALLFWPDEILQGPGSADEEPASSIATPLSQQSPSARPVKRESYIGPGSPYLSPSFRAPKDRQTSTLVNAPLTVVLKHPSFLLLATWVAIHILKLNFVVATLNDQLEAQDNLSADDKASLIDIFGAMLPFGFVALPLVATMLQTSVLYAYQLANAVGLAYGAVLVFCPSNKWLLVGIVFPAVATSRQLVYSTVFHQLGAAFGFANYGVLLGVTNCVVSTFSLLQNPMVHWSELQDSYEYANWVLMILTLPLFLAVWWMANPKAAAEVTANKKSTDHADEIRRLLEPMEGTKPRSYSTA